MISQQNESVSALVAPIIEAISVDINGEDDDEENYELPQDGHQDSNDESPD